MSTPHANGPACTSYRQRRVTPVAAAHDRDLFALGHPCCRRPIHASIRSSCILRPHSPLAAFVNALPNPVEPR